MPPGFTSVRFVGRESAFVRLAPVLQAATDGLSVTVLVDGPGGIGSSRLLTEAGARPTGTDSPYAPIIRALKPALTTLEEADLAALVGSGAEDLVRLMPELHARL